MHTLLEIRFSFLSARRAGIRLKSSVAWELSIAKAEENEAIEKNIRAVESLLIYIKKLFNKLNNTIFFFGPYPIIREFRYPLHCIVRKHSGSKSIFWEKGSG